MRRRNAGRAPLVIVAVSTLCALAIACSRSRDSRTDQPATPSGPAWFEDATDTVGLNFVQNCGPTGTYFMPQQIGSGGALFDYDDDGRLDLYLVQNAGPNSGVTNRLYHQEPGGTFRDVSAGSGLDVAGYGMGVAVGDVNNDGRPDVVLTEYRGIRLFLNNGNGTFTEATKPAGLATVNWATSASFVDYDRDGWLDLVVVQYLDYDPSQVCLGARGRPDFCHPKMFPPSVTRLFRNLGAQSGGKVAFKDVTTVSRLAEKPGPSLGVMCADFDGDDWPDIFVANDSAANHLWINQRNGTFREEAIERGCAYNAAGRPEANMGVVFGDVDGDGLPDLFVTHLTEETNTLWLQGPRGTFTDRTRQANLANPARRGTGFGVILADFDRDGRPDLAVTNGRVFRAPNSNSPGFDWADYAEPNHLFANDGDGRFRDVNDPVFCGSRGVGRGLCGGDVFNRGRIDLVVMGISAPARLYRNVAPAAGHWLGVRAFAPEWKRDAYGAVVTVRAAGREQSRLIQPGSSYLVSNDPRAHFGLGAAETVDSIRIAWPDGSVERFPGGSVDRHLTVRKGEGVAAK